MLMPYSFAPGEWVFSWLGLSKYEDSLVAAAGGYAWLLPSPPPCRGIEEAG